MPRTIRLVAIGLSAIAAFAAAMAQPAANVPDCKWQEINATLAAGAIPDFTGCPAKVAQTRLRQAFGNSVPVELKEAGNPSSWPIGTVTMQVRDGRQVQLYYAAKPVPAEVAPAAPIPPPIVGAAPPAPPPPAPPPPPAAVIPAGVPGAVVHPDVTPTEIYQNATFSILDAAPVEAGQTLVFIVRREGHAGQAYQVNFEYSGGGLTVDPPKFMRFEAGEPSQKNLEVRTATAQSGEGANIVQVTLHTNDDGAVIGEPATASGTITKAAQPPPVATYSIVADGTFSRGFDLPFKVSRTGPLGPARIAYRISQDDPTAMIDDTQQFVEFAKGQADAPLVVPAGRYGDCASTVTVTLDDGAATSATANFVEPPPDWCGPPPPWWREYLPLILGGIALAGAIILDKILKPFVTVHGACTITPGTAAFRALEQPVLRWPEVKADVAFEPGELYVTQPLPRSEPADG